MINDPPHLKRVATLPYKY